MRKIYLLLLLSCLAISVMAQYRACNPNQPVFKTQVVRHVAHMDIEGVKYDSVTVTVRADDRTYVMTDFYEVHVKIVNQRGKKIFKRTWKDNYLYIYPNGQIQVGRPQFDRLVIYPSSHEGFFNGKLREKEGVYQQN